mgnify:CR=1 FL=1
MKGKFFYKIDYNTDNWKKQYRNSKVGKNYHNLEKSGLKPGKIRCFWYYSPHFCANFVRKQGFRMYSRNLSALAFAADFPPAAPEFHQRTHRVRLRNLGTPDKKSSHKIKHRKTPRVHLEYSGGNKSMTRNNKNR